MATGGSILWKPKLQPGHEAGVSIKGSLTPDEWADFQLALIELGKEFGVNITPIDQSKHGSSGTGSDSDYSSAGGIQAGDSSTKNSKTEDPKNIGIRPKNK